MFMKFMIGLVFGMIFGHLIAGWVADYLDNIKWRKQLKWEDKWDQDHPYSPTKYSCGNISWTKDKLEIKGKLKN